MYEKTSVNILTLFCFVRVNSSKFLPKVLVDARSCNF